MQKINLISLFRVVGKRNSDKESIGENVWEEFAKLDPFLSNEII